MIKPYLKRFMGWVISIGLVLGLSGELTSIGGDREVTAQPFALVIEAAGGGQAYLPLIETPGVQFVWSGAITPTSAVIKAKIGVGATLRLWVSTSPDFVNGFFTPPTIATQETNGVVPIELEGLIPDTQYFYLAEVNGRLDDSSAGRFHTFPEGPGTFTFALGGDAFTGSNRLVFETILNHNPLFFLHLGDFHYLDINVNDVNLYRQAYETVLASPRQSNLYQNIGLVYIWDDHDYGNDNSDSTNPGRAAAQLTYREYVPHYPLAAGDGANPIYFTFSVGRVFFIVTDTRSMRTPNSAQDDENKTMLGIEQKEWFKQQLLNASGIYPVIVWVSTSPWLVAPYPGGDNWEGFTTERAELSNFIKANQIEGLFMLSADIHMLAIDDGTNNNYADGGGPNFPVFLAAPLDHGPSSGGGPYSEGFSA